MKVVAPRVLRCLRVRSTGYSSLSLQTIQVEFGVLRSRVLASMFLSLGLKVSGKLALQGIKPEPHLLMQHGHW